MDPFASLLSEPFLTRLAYTECEAAVLVVVVYLATRMLGKWIPARMAFCVVVRRLFKAGHAERGAGAVGRLSGAACAGPTNS